MKAEPSPSAAHWDAYLFMLESAYRRSAWHGKNLTSTLKGVDAPTAHRVPRGKRRSVWQIVLHCAYWAYRIRCRLTGDKGRGFPRRGSDWLNQPAMATEDLWKEDCALLRDEYDKLRELLIEFRDGRRDCALPAEEADTMIVGAAFHAIHHGSQIMQYRRLLEEEDARKS